MHEKFRLFIQWFPAITLLCYLSGCGGGATVSGGGAIESVANTILSDSTTSSGPAPVVETVADVRPANTQDRVPSDTLQTTENTEVSAVQSPTADTGEPVPEELLFPIDTGNESTRVTPPPGTSESQPVEAREYSIADITDLILVTGQSNALGADTTYDPAKDAPHKRVFAFTEDGWLPADLHQVWDLGWFPRGNKGGDPSNNFSLHAAKEIAYRQSDRVVGFVLASAPGESIDHWGSDGDFFAEIDRKVLSAINQLPHKSGVDAILWHQGESDEGDHGYGEKLDNLIKNFRQQSWFASDRPFICGETAAFDIVNQQLMAINNNGDRWSACVDGAGLQTREDGYHFNAQGLRELGRRYGARYLSMDK